MTTYQKILKQKLCHFCLLFIFFLCTFACTATKQNQYNEGFRRGFEKGTSQQKPQIYNTTPALPYNQYQRPYSRRYTNPYEVKSYNRKIYPYYRDSDQYYSIPKEYQNVEPPERSVIWDSKQ